MFQGSSYIFAEEKERSDFYERYLHVHKNEETFIFFFN